jgi:hypothetical protein
MKQEFPLTTHVFTTNAPGVSPTFDIPVPPASMVPVIDWILFAVTSTTARGEIHVGIRRADSTHLLYQEYAIINTTGDPASLKVTFPEGFGVYFPNFTTGNPGTLAEHTDVVGSQLEVFAAGSGATITGINFSCGYHYEPRAWRSFGVL